MSGKRGKSSPRPGPLLYSLVSCQRGHCWVGRRPSSAGSTLTQTFPLSPWLALLDKRTSRFWPHSTPTSSSHPLHTWGACAPEFTLDGISSCVGTFPPPQPIRCPEAWVGGEQPRQSGLFAFCSEAPHAPSSFPRSPGLWVPPVDEEAGTLPVLSLLGTPLASAAVP